MQIIQGGMAAAVRANIVHSDVAGDDDVGKVRFLHFSYNCFDIILYRLFLYCIIDACEYELRHRWLT